MAERAKERRLYHEAIEQRGASERPWREQRDAEDLRRYRATLQLGTAVLYQHHRHFGGPIQESVTRDQCAKCQQPNPDLSHHVLEYIAATLAEPLRRAVRRHLEEHGCDLFRCETATELWYLQPGGDSIILA